MARVVSYVFNTLFERKESVPYREKRTVVLVFTLVSACTLILLLSFS